jgi:hypothetical protein
VDSGLFRYRVHTRLSVSAAQLVFCSPCQAVCLIHTHPPHPRAAAPTKSGGPTAGSAQHNKRARGLSQRRHWRQGNTAAAVAAATAARGFLTSVSTHLHDEVGLQAAVLDVQPRGPQVRGNHLITEIGQEASWEGSNVQETIIIVIRMLTGRETAC